MRSFTFAVIAAAFATLVGAVPVASPLGNAGVVSGATNVVQGSDPEPHGGHSSQLRTRADEHDLYTILGDFSNTCEPNVEKLHDANPSDDVQIKGIIVVITGAINVAVPRVKGLVQVGVVSDVANLGRVLAGILNPILLAVSVLLKVVSVEVQALLKGLIVTLLVLVGDILLLVEGLDVVLGPLISEVGYAVFVALDIDVSPYRLSCGCH